MKNPQILILLGVAVIIIIGLSFSGPYNAEAPAEDIINTEESMEVSTSSSENISDESTRQVPSTNETTPQSTPNTTETPVSIPQTEPSESPGSSVVVRDNGDVEIEQGVMVNDVLANSKRCRWYDPETGNEYDTLQKDEYVKLTTETKDDMTIYAVYSDVAVHVWEQNADEGYVFSYTSNTKSPLLFFSTRNDVISEMYTHERSQCDDKTLNNSHFEIPNNVTFTSL